MGCQWGVYQSSFYVIRVFVDSSGGETLVNVFLGAFSTKFAFFSLPSKQSSVYVFWKLVDGKGGGDPW